MKVGILTFHRAKNFGAVLQCYALFNFLKSNGYDVYVIDYKPPYLAGIGDEGSLWKQIKLLAKSLFYWLMNAGETGLGNVFNRFVEKELKLAELTAVNSMDVIVCGSDQIWNPAICKGFDPIFFGGSPILPEKRVISYAASMGRSEFSGKERMEFLKLIERMNAISVREYSTGDLLQSWGVKCDVVVDPVLLAGCECFKNILVSIRQHKPYVLVYELTPLRGTYSFAKRIAAQLDADVVVIGGGAKKYFCRGIKNKQGLSPAQFVSYFANASYVVTNSFHGTAFSILYGKPFYCLKTNTWKDERIEALLIQLNQLDRLVDCNNFDFSHGESYSDNQIAQLKSKSKQFLLYSIRKS